MTSCKVNDEIIIYFEFASTSAVFEGNDVCFNNAKYGINEDIAWHVNPWDTPYTPYRNCFRYTYGDTEYDDTEPVTCRYKGLQLRIGVTDNVNTGAS